MTFENITQRFSLSGKKIETPNDPEMMSPYEQVNKELDEQIVALEQEIRDMSNQGQDIDTLQDNLSELRLEKIRVSANYPGDWTNLLMARMLDPITKEKFIQTRREAMVTMKTGTLGFLDKPEYHQGYYEEQIENYDRNVEYVFSATGIGLASEFNKKPTNLGKGDLGMQGTIFLDAVNEEGLILNDRQFNIIEAHEKGHGLRDFTSNIDKHELVSCIDCEALKVEQTRQQKDKPELRFYNYLTRPEEIAERMAQLKNYFGFTAEDVFTAEHLHYAKEHYVVDTGLDNRMTEFLLSITPEVETKFLETINKYPL